MPGMVTPVKIAADTVLEDLRLADIDNLARRILHQVDSGPFGQLGYTAAYMFVHFNHLFIEKLKLFLSYGLNINYLITIRNGSNAITEKK